MFPEVLEAFLEFGAKWGEDGVGAANGPLHAALLEVSADDVAAEFVKRLAVRVDAEAEGARGVTAVELVLADLEDGFLSRTSLRPA